MDQPIAFFGGIHGAGKTTVSRLVATLLSASHVTAGALIRETAHAADVLSRGTVNKAVPDVDANQALLLRGLDLFRARVGIARPIVLDGHFSLLSEAGQIVSVPLDVFKAIGPVAVVLVETGADVVRERLLQRDNDAPRVETIVALAEREQARAAEVCSALNIPRWTVRGDVPTEHTASWAAKQLRAVFNQEA